MSSSNYCFLTCIQISQEAGQVVQYSHLLKNFSVCCDPYKGFGIASKAEIDLFLELSCFLDNPTMLSIWSLIPLPFLNPVCMYGSSQFKNGWSLAWRIFEHYLASMWNEHNWAVLFTSFGIVFLWDLNENWPFRILWPLLSFPNLLAYRVEHFNSIIF